MINKTQENGQNIFTTKYRGSLNTIRNKRQKKKEKKKKKRVDNFFRKK